MHFMIDRQIGVEAWHEQAERRLQEPEEPSVDFGYVRPRAGA
jgi:hypothetical protein